VAIILFYPFNEGIENFLYRWMIRKKFPRRGLDFVKTFFTFLQETAKTINR